MASLRSYSARCMEYESCTAAYVDFGFIATDAYGERAPKSVAKRRRVARYASRPPRRAQLSANSMAPDLFGIPAPAHFAMGLAKRAASFGANLTERFTSFPSQMNLIASGPIALQLPFRIVFPYWHASGPP